MKTIIIILSIILGCLLFNVFALFKKSATQSKEIIILKQRVDSLEFSIYLDSVSTASYHKARKMLHLE